MLSAKAQPVSAFAVAKELRKQWLIFQENGYRAYEGQYVKAIYFNLEAPAYKGDFLSLRSPNTFAVFINQKLITKKNQRAVLLNIDSLSRLYSPALSITVFQPDGIRSLESNILVPAIVAPATEADLMPRKENFFLDFCLLAALLLSVYFVLLFRTNPRLTLDYVNVSKIITVQEREEILLTTRIASSVNLLFYLFCSAFCSLALLAIFYFGTDKEGVAHYFPMHSIGQGFWQWTKLSVIIAALLFVKLMTIYVFSALFALRDKSAIQYFNFIRTLFFIIGLVSTVCIAYFVYYHYPTGPHSHVLNACAWVLGFSVIMIFLKLMALAPFSFFHLFSYLCASEIIPLVILLKVLLY